MTPKNNKFFLTTPIYYVNDQPHLGHAYTTVAADVFSRWQKLQGKEVFFLTGTDEHGAKISQAAEKLGKDPQKFCDEISEQFKESWRALNIDYSYFIRTTDKKHEEGVIKFLNLLQDKGFLYEADYTGLYCLGCEKFITEKELVDGKCPDHQREPEKISEKNWFFKLKQFLPQIEKLIINDEILIQPENSKKEVLGLFKQNLDDFSVSRQNIPWGIKLPWDKSQTVYVWVDALLNYWTALENGQQNFWPPDLHLMARDILKFHAIYWPAMLLAAGMELPQRMFIHGYFTINGQKMSKTLHNTINPNDLIKKFGLEATRYLLLSQFPFGNDGDISLNKLTETYNNNLANGLGNLVARVAKFQMSNCKLQIVDESLDKYNNLMEQLKFYETIKMIQEKIGECDTLIDQIKPWKIEDKAQQKESLKDIVQQILVIAKMVESFMPNISERIFNIFSTGKSEILFPRV